MAKTSTGLDENTAGLLCYLAGWITGLIFILIEKDNKFVRFHAVQSIVVFGIFAIVIIILRFFGFIGWIISGIVGIIAIIFWIILMVKAYQGQKYKLPLSGDIAEKNS